MFEKGEIDENYVRVERDELFKFIVNVMVKLGVNRRDAKIFADNLVTADLRGIESHGVQRLKRYVNGILSGGVNVKSKIRIVREGETYALLDGDRGLGQIIGFKAMKIAINKARDHGLGFVLVKNSNHYGIAGYYALIAAKEEMIGISMTNSRPLVAPTNSIDRFLGTNPIAFAAPTNSRPFLLDMATSIVPIGKLEVYRRKERKIPRGWAIDSNGNLTDNPEDVFNGGALLPLGGLGEILGGHKGYGLSLMIDIITGILSGGVWSRYVKNTEHRDSNVSHLFTAINIEAFMPLKDFKKRMDEMIAEIKKLRRHSKFNEIWIHGEKGFLTEETRLKIGIPIYRKVLCELNIIADQLKIDRLKVK